MSENNKNILGVTEISSVVIDSLKNNPNASKNNDFAISTDTSREPVTILISLGQGRGKILSTIKKKLEAGEFVVQKDKNNDDELYFVFFKKDLQKQPTDNNVKDVLLLPTVEILETLNKKKAERCALDIANLVHDYIIKNQNMNLQQRLSDLYNGKNNENINPINEGIDGNRNSNQGKENNNTNLNNNLNNSLIKNENNNEIKSNNNSIDNNIINENLKNGQENNKTEITTNTVSLFGLGCYQIPSDGRDNHSCSCCFW